MRRSMAWRAMDPVLKALRYLEDERGIAGLAIGMAR